MDSEGPSTSIHSSEQTRIYVDNCLGALAEVPATFDYGTIKVKLCSVSLSQNFVSIGSECGALFLYNRRFKRALKPLRTTYDEVITVQKWYHQNENEYLAIGHRSGNLILLSLPSADKKSIQSDLHKYYPITALEWSKNGKYLFSSDASGLIMGLSVDFDKDTYTPIFIQNNGNPIRFLAFEPDFIISVETRFFDVIQFEDNITTHISRHDMGQKVTGVQLFEGILSMVLSDGKLKRFSLNEKKVLETIELEKNTIESALLPEVFVGGEQREAAPATWTKSDWKFAVTKFYSNSHILQYSQHRVQLLDIQSLVTPVQLYVVDLRLQLPNLKDVEVISADFDLRTEETMILTSTRHLLRLGFTPPDNQITGQNSNSTLLSAFSSVAQKSSKKFFQKFTKPEYQQMPVSQLPNLPNPLSVSFSGTFHNFINSENNKQMFSNVLESIERIVSPDKAPIPEELHLNLSDRVSDSEEVTEESEFESDKKSEGSRKSAQRRTEMGVARERENRKNSNQENAKDNIIGQEGKICDDDGLLNGTEDTLDSVGNGGLVFANSDVKEHWNEVEVVSEASDPVEEPADIVEDHGIAVEEPNVEVQRKLKTITRPINIEQAEGKEDEEEDFFRSCEPSTSASVQNSLCDENLESILGALASQRSLSKPDLASPVPLPSWTPTDHGYGDEITVEEPEIRVEEVAEESVPLIITDQETKDKHESFSTNLDSDSESTSSESEKVEIAEEAATDSDVTTFSNISTTATSISISVHQNPEYPTITRLANQRTDVWNRIPLPYTSGHFDVTRNYIVICGTKSRQKPHYRMVETMENAMLGGDWTPIGYKAEKIAVNDSGTLLWRVEKSIAHAPIKVDPLCPNSKHWLEQANEGKIHEVSLTERTAWYLTDKGPFVQMNLPEMGILYRAECPFELEQITATEQAVWALRKGTGSIVVRVGLKHCPMGLDWVEDSSYTLAGPSTFVSICLFETTAFGLDVNGELWLCNGVDENKPFGVGKWYQVCSPTNLMPTSQKKSFLPIPQWRLKISSAGVFINVGKYILSSRQPLTANIFNKAIPARLSIHDTFLFIAASGYVGESNDFIFVGQPNSDLFAFSASHRNLTSLPGFGEDSTVTALTAARDRLYALDSCGVVHVRDGINAQLTPRGTEWTKLDTAGLESPVISFAASSASLWAITADQKIFFSSQSSKASFTNWMSVPPPASAENIDIICCSPAGKYVWILSSLLGQAWARFDRQDNGYGLNSNGPDWTQACPDVKLANLAIADNAVYALEANTNRLYRLRALSAANPAGLYWKSLPEKLRAISVDAFEQRLWGLDMNNCLVKHEIQIFPRSCLAQPNNRDSSSTVSSEPRLFKVFDDEQPSSSIGSDWFDAEKDRHEP
ncbi:unnamed protein product [Bursaphelenchus xylophilus]|uniref:(pine wood nematode) hypothetical protein n=1 Tax=Bursaphelenchus xylophilus TaxID=6326 RepID=A0A1I7RTR2_BURXY|nr:unnamed protein product [Bursaphelenchus xylophilus]CAG9122198.1 unnamed protein product [Bursaphelenchus xylophilus]